MLSGYTGERLLLTLWVGSLWAIGYLAVPMAFATMDVTLAGDYAGRLFYAVNVLGIACSVVLMVSRLYVYRASTVQYWRFWIIVAMLLITLVSAFYLQPQMADIKQLPWRGDAMLQARFSRLHMMSENLYLLLSLFGLLLVLTTDKLSSDKA